MREVTSETVGTLRSADTRGKTDLALEEVAATTCVKGDESVRSFSNRGASVSAMGLAYCPDVEWSTDVTPFSLATIHDQSMQMGTNGTRTS